jgi:hypothetical protein
MYTKVATKLEVEGRCGKKNSIFFQSVTNLPKNGESMTKYSLFHFILIRNFPPKKT